MKHILNKNPGVCELAVYFDTNNVQLNRVYDLFEGENIIGKNPL